MDKNLELLRTYVLALPGPEHFEVYSINLCILMHFEGKKSLKKTFQCQQEEENTGLEFNGR